MRLFDHVDLVRVVRNFVQRTIPDALQFIQKVVYHFVLSIFGSDDIHDIGTKLSNITDVTSHEMFLLTELDSDVSKYYEPQLQEILAYSLIRKDANLYRMIGEKVLGTPALITYGINFGKSVAISMTDELGECMTDLNESYTDLFDVGKVFILYIFPYSFVGIYPLQEEVDALIERYLPFFRIVKAARHNVIFIEEPYLVWGYSDHIGIVQQSTPFSDSFSSEFLNNLTIYEISDHLIPSIDSSEYTYDSKVHEEDRSITFRFLSKQVFERINFDFDFVQDQPYFNTDQDENEFSDQSVVTDDIPSAELVPFRGILDSTKIKVVQYTGYIPVSIKLVF